MLVLPGISIVYLAQPYLNAGLAASSVQRLQIVDIYSCIVAGFLIRTGTLAARIERRRLLHAGTGTFTVVPVQAVFSTSAEMLIAFRAIAGRRGSGPNPPGTRLDQQDVHR
ncbi:hypothetical protein LWP59_29015 [Amycolatopsis acidiphila]|uniref:Uncharacterized protein n=1 Tax=Amycolatopsis acidiphila TaxID=715473 RepID=A0A558AF18_9PSEU|nr:hypothetical protein [Amycolatopsis acidiphila]TVT22850.1 hypothetical protein FNH06_12215 [Amycolatopsis acidiphila]UIJ58138.1 hypothetical protein LWP59_29015 [Amycolatopsis acidiphila]GHG69846.1 hypothetical protein GCM10017788_30390 [Amycolatopsis acidiphila]